jgi:hypothetical protein
VGIKRLVLTTTIILECIDVRSLCIAGVIAWRNTDNIHTRDHIFKATTGIRTT